MHCSKKYNALVVASAPLQTELQLSCCHRSAGWAAQPHLEDSWLGRERRDGPLAAGPHRRKKKKNKEVVASSLAGDMSTTLSVVGEKGGGGGFTSGRKRPAPTEEAGAEASSGWLRNGRRLRFGKGHHRAQW
jgi:hypothetical protein